MVFMAIGPLVRHATQSAPFAWKQKGAYAAAFEEAMVSAHNAR
jgi:hypothetical protein